MEGKVTNRWLVVFGSLIMQLSLGAIYTWSLFNNPLIEKIRLGSRSDRLYFFSYFSVFALSVIIAGGIQDRIGPRKVATVGGLLTGTGVALSCLATTPMMLYITYGFIAGVGISTTYVTH